MDKSKSPSIVPWEIQAEEDVAAYGFMEFDEEDSAGFMLTPVDVKSQLKDELVALGVSMKCLVMVTNKRQIIRKMFNKAGEFKTIPLPYKGVLPKVSIYMDLYGYHCFIIVSPKAMFYLGHKMDSAMMIEKLQGKTICSVAFPSETQPKSTGTMLIGTDDGSIYTYRLEVEENERIAELELDCVFQAPDKSPIYGLVYEDYKCESATEGKAGMTTLVLAATNHTCYQFVGPMPFQDLFHKYSSQKDLDKYKQTAPLGEIVQSELKLYHTYEPEKGFELDSFAWKTGTGVCYGKFRRAKAYKESVMVKDFIFEPYKKQGVAEGIDVPIPQAVGINDYHLFLLYPNNLTIVSKVTKEIDYAEDFKPSEKMLNMIYEPTTHSMWIHSIKKVYKLAIAPADKDLWKNQLNNGNFKEALKICKATKNKYYGYAAGIYADEEFAKKNYKRAAELYCLSNKSFEEVVVKFVVAEENDSLQEYLTTILERLEDKEEALIQRDLLCSWLIELKLDKLNKVSAEAGELLNGKPNKKVTKPELVDYYRTLAVELREFLMRYEESIDPDVVFQLLQSYGKPEDCLWFAKEKENYEAMVLYFINNRRVKRALEIVSSMPEGTKKNELMTRYASVFMKYETKETIENLISNFPTIDVEALMPALMSTDSEHRLFANTFVRQTIEKTTSNKLLYNLYLFFLSQSDDPAFADELSHFLESQESYQKRNIPLNFDKDFGLNVFKFFGRTTALVRTYAMLELHEEAVLLALAENLFSLAKEYASMPTDPGVCKRLWLDIARAVMGKESPDMQASFELVKESKGNLVLNDVLQYISPKVKLKTFRDDILSQVNVYDARIGQSQDEIHEYNQISQEVLDQQKDLLNTPIFLPPDKGCDKCEKVLTGSGKFFAFPCFHAFHRNCLLDWYEGYRICMSRAKVTKMEAMETYKKQMQQKLVLMRMPVMGNAGKSLLESVEAALATKNMSYDDEREVREEDYAYLQALEKKFEDLLSNECVLCGEIAIEKLDTPFDSEKELDWAIQRINHYSPYNQPHIT
eukprot:TRINITY_DN232_c0_g1_i1.p1 TRINITY_DN232_c0_g1~~TRINITY_DN232_c0_g1_i1.p1  ORF type:complete len:1070 (-),score=123.23 TRINITY_DN232_c0_g1_i1:8437-11544(-)